MNILNLMELHTALSPVKLSFRTLVGVVRTQRTPPGSAPSTTVDISWIEEVVTVIHACTLQFSLGKHLHQATVQPTCRKQCEMAQFDAFNVPLFLLQVMVGNAHYQCCVRYAEGLQNIALIVDLSVGFGLLFIIIVVIIVIIVIVRYVKRRGEQEVTKESRENDKQETSTELSHDVNCKDYLEAGTYYSRKFPDDNIRDIHV